MKNATHSVSFDEEPVIVHKQSHDEQPHIKRRAGLIPMHVPLQHGHKSPELHDKVDFGVLEVMHNKKQNSSPAKFARALGIPDKAARHLLNDKKYRPLKPHPRHSYRPGIRSILRGPSIYDLPNARRSPNSQSPEIEPEQHTFQKKPSLYDLILKNSSSKNKMDMFKIFSVRERIMAQKEISKEVESDDDSSAFNSLFFSNKVPPKSRSVSC